MRNLVHEVLASLELLRDEKRVELAKTYYPTSMRVIGVIGPDIKLVVKELRNKTKSASARERIELAVNLAVSGVMECQQVAFEYLGRDKKLKAELTVADVEKMGKTMDNWVSVDMYSGYIVGYCWRIGTISTEKVLSYLESPDHWIRRIAVVSTVSLNQKSLGGAGDVERTIDVCRRVVDDHHDKIVKALSWALRVLSKVEKEPVIRFMEQYHDRLHGRVRREVWNKLNTGKKKLILCKAGIS